LGFPFFLLFGVRRLDGALSVSEPGAVATGSRIQKSHDPVATAPGSDTPSSCL